MLSTQTMSLSQIPNEGLPLKELTRSMLAKYFEDSISDSLKLSILPEDISKNKIDGKTMDEFIASELKKVQYNQNIPQSENFDQLLVNEIINRKESDHPFESPNIILGLGQLYLQAIELLETLRNNDPMYLLKTIIIDELNREKDFSLQTSPKGETWTKIYRIFEKQNFLLEKKEKASKGGRIAPYETLFETLELFKTHEEFQKCVKVLYPSLYKKLVESIGSQNKNGIHKDNLGHYQQLTKVLGQIAQQLRIKYQLWKPLISLDTFSVGVYSTKVRGYDPNNKRYYTKKSLHTKDALAINYIAISELISIFTLQLQDDEDFIKVYSIDFQAGVSYSVVTEFGLGNLSEFHKFRLRENIPWSQSEINELSKSITKQLQKLKDLDIAHRDINPENIVVTEKLTFKIKDFSTSEKHTDHEPQFIIVGGTPGYWHPEIEASIDKCHNIVKLNPYENDKYSVERIISLIEQFMNKSKTSENSLHDAKEFKKHMIGRIYRHLGVPEQPKLTVVFTALYSLDETEEWFRDQLMGSDMIKQTNMKEWLIYLLGCMAFLRKDYSRALQYFKIQLNLRLDLIDKKHESIAELHEKTGIAAYMTEDTNLSIKSIESSLKIKEKIFGKSSLEVANSKILLGVIDIVQEEDSNPKTFFDSAMDMASKIIPPDNANLAQYYFYQGLGELVQGGFTDALQLFLKGTKLQLEKGNTVNMDLVIGTFVLTFHNLEDETNHQEAIKLTENILNAVINKLGEHHPDSIFCFSYLAVTYHSANDFKEAMKLYTKAVDLIKKNLGERNPILAKIYHNIALMYLGTKKSEAAIAHFKQALSILQQSREYFECFDLLFSYMGVGELLLHIDEKSDLSRILPHLSELDIKRDIISNNFNIGLANLEEKKYKSALKYFANTLDLEKKTLGENHPNLITTYTHIGIVLDAEANYDEAIKSYKQALALAMVHGGEFQETVAEIYQAVGMLYDKMNRGKKAAEWFAKALNVRKNLEIDQTADISKLENLISILSK